MVRTKQQAARRKLIFSTTQIPSMQCCGYANCLRIPVSKEESIDEEIPWCNRKLLSKQQFCRLIMFSVIFRPFP